MTIEIHFYLEEMFLNNELMGPLTGFLEELNMDWDMTQTNLKDTIFVKSGNVDRRRKQTQVKFNIKGNS